MQCNTISLQISSCCCYFVICKMCSLLRNGGVGEYPITLWATYFWWVVLSACANTVSLGFSWKMEMQLKWALTNVAIALFHLFIAFPIAKGVAPPPPLLWQAAAALRLTLVSTEKLSLKQEALTKDPVLNDCKSYCNAWANCRQIKDTNRNPQVLSINWFPCHILIWEYSMVCTGFHRSHTYMGGFKISPHWIR